MTNRQNGAVLLTTLGMIVIFTMIVFSMMQALYLYIKVSHRIAATHEALYQLELIAQKLPLEKIVDDCVFTGVDMNQMVDLIKAHQGCQWLENKKKYDYLIDDLGIFPCLPFLVDKTLVASHHWIITVSSAASLQAVLQLRIAKPSTIVRCDDRDAHPIEKGIISWRYLTST